MFKRSSDRLEDERAYRKKLKGRFLRFGISFLDEATRGISPNDLMLLGAPTGVGKTELCVHIALANIEDGKRVHFIALEADFEEIERRLLYALIARQFYDDPNRPRLLIKLNMSSWMRGDYEEALSGYEELAKKYLSSALNGLFTFYKADKFNTDDLIHSVMGAASETDLVIVDHIHYFDWETDDNRAIKEIAKTARQVSIHSGKPILLVAHLRKRDRHNKELVPGIDEFHGSSDLSKIATKVITIAKGPRDPSGKSVTFMRICKNRLDGSVTGYVARMLFDFKTKTYDRKIKLSEVGNEFKELVEYPWWAEEIRDDSGPRMGTDGTGVVKRQPFSYSDT